MTDTTKLNKLIEKRGRQEVEAFVKYLQRDEPHPPFKWLAPPYQEILKAAYDAGALIEAMTGTGSWLYTSKPYWLYGRIYRIDPTWVLPEEKKEPDSFARSITCYRRENEQLRAIVNTLPKTVDGVTITLGMQVWALLYEGGYSQDGTMLEWVTRPMMVRVITNDDLWQNIYSTRDAAEAAGYETQ